MPDLFEKRIRRAETLEKEWPFAAEILRFFRSLTALQQETFERFSAAPAPPKTTDLHPLVAPLLRIIERDGPAELSRHTAHALEAETFTRGLMECVAGKRPEDAGLELVLRTLLLPFLLALRKRRGAAFEPDSEAPNVCPSCKHPPLVSLLREDKQADTVRRTLICSLCSFEWDFARVLCPNCKEEKPEKLPRYSAQEIPWMRVEACDSCKTYLKSVDLTLNWEAEPVVDELASTPLDVIAREQGYTKLSPNLAGI
jgi:FdhE protein